MLAPVHFSQDADALSLGTKTWKVQGRNVEGKSVSTTTIIWMDPCQIWTKVSPESVPRIPPQSSGVVDRRVLRSPRTLLEHLWDETSSTTVL